MSNLTKMSKGFDSGYYDFIFSKLLNLLMKDGKKNVALKIITKSISKAKKQLNLKYSNEVLVKAVFNASPDLEIKSKRVGTGVYQVPKPVDINRKLVLGSKNLIEVSCPYLKESQPYAIFGYNIIIDVYYNFFANFYNISKILCILKININEKLK